MPVPLKKISADARMPAAFMKGAAYGMGMGFTTIGTALCLSDEDAAALIEFVRKTPVPLRDRDTVRGFSPLSSTVV